MRTATLAYDAVALIAALVKTQGPQRFSPEVLTNPSGFTGIDGLFRFRADGTNERGLAVLRVTAVGTADHRAGAAQFWRAAGEQSWSGFRSSPERPDQLQNESHLTQRSLQAARSATTASSTGKPGMLTRSRPAAVISTKPLSRKAAIRAGVERPAGQRRVALRIDAFGEPQAHQQKFVGDFLAREHVVGDEAMPVVLDAGEPSLRALFGRGCMPVAVDIEPAMRARPDAGIFVRAPVDEIVPALGARPRMIGNLIGRQPVRRADLLRRVVKRARGIVVGHFELAGRMQRGERRLRLDGQLIERQMLAGFGNRAL